MKAALTIAGSDSGGGAGIQADLKTFAAHQVYGATVITAVTAQNTTGVWGIAELAASFVALQAKAVLTDLPIDAIKIGMLANAEIIKAVAQVLNNYSHIPVVLDPVMIAKSGDHLLQPAARQALIKYLFPLAKLITPNLHEASVITGFEVEEIAAMKKAARMIKKMGAANILIKGGHLKGDAVDLLFDGCDFYYFTALRLPNTNTHGTGCTYSAAIAANLAQGLDLNNAISQAKKYITGAIDNAFPIGKGTGPVHHFYRK